MNLELNVFRKNRDHHHPMFRWTTKTVNQLKTDLENQSSTSTQYPNHDCCCFFLSSQDSSRGDKTSISAATRMTDEEDGGRTDEARPMIGLLIPASLRQVAFPYRRLARVPSLLSLDQWRRLATRNGGGTHRSVVVFRTPADFALRGNRKL